MRRLFVVLLITLLPLRSWAGDAMAISMGSMAGPSVAIESIAGDDHSAWTSGPFDQETAAEMPADCPMLAQAGAAAATAPADGAASAAQPACHGCDTCALCLALFTSGADGIGHLAVSHRTLPPEPTASMASADPVPGFKPPIS
jgi:hypothetical protein